MSIITLARLSRPLRTRCFSGINIAEYLTAAHKRETTRLRGLYEAQLSQLRQELKSLRNAKLKWERREKQKRRNERIKRKQQDSERERRQEREPERAQERSVEAQLMCDKIKLLHEVARLRRAVSATSSLHIIDSLYCDRRCLDPPGPQSVLSAIINGALDTPLRTYSYSRQKAISLLDPALQEDEVDKAGHDLYRACLPLQKQDSQPIILREGQLSLPSVAAFFALAHWSQAEISVDYLLKSGKVAASIGDYISE